MQRSGHTIRKLLDGNDLRSLGDSALILKAVHNEKDFSQVFKFIFHEERGVAMKAIDLVEKITRHHDHYLQPHAGDIVRLFKTAGAKEIRWHLAQLITRVQLTSHQIKLVWSILSRWLLNANESKIVRVNSLEAMYRMSEGNHALRNEILEIMRHLEKDTSPSISARIRKLTK